MLENMLNLKNLIILDMEESKDDYRFLVETTTPAPSRCFKCGSASNLYKHGKKKRYLTISILQLQTHIQNP